MLDLVILTAVASCLNSALYTASRMAYSLSSRGDAPRAWSRVTGNGVPATAIIASSMVGFLGVIGNYVLPGEIFGYLLASSGAIALFVYLVIALSQLKMRRELDAEGTEPAVRMWAFPALTYITIAFIVGVLVLMVIRPGSPARALAERRAGRRHHRGRRAEAPPDRGTGALSDRSGVPAAADGAPDGGRDAHTKDTSRHTGQ